MRIIEATANRMGISKEQVMINIERFGNTTSATIPLCLWEWEPKLKKGDNIIIATFGAGFTWGAAYLLNGPTTGNRFKTFLSTTSSIASKQSTP
jgi:3-oxoacyl-[acyl-carrier-protein] synthase III